MSRTRRDHLGCSGYGMSYIGAFRKLLGRDRKPWSKPPRWYKAMKQRIRRAKDAQAMRLGMEPERWRRTNVWEWT
jgi:hypothetical protein